MALNPLDRVVRDVEDLKRQIAGRSQLNHSSLENTAIPVYDGDGTERLRIGAQDDGTHSVKYVQGPPPPRPTAPVVSVDGPVVRVRWDGMLMGGHIPEDFSRIDVHFALASEDLEADAAVRGNLATSAGNETVLAATQTGTYRVGLVAMSQSRARSDLSDTVTVDVTLVDLEGALDAVVENARGGSNHYSPEPPAGTDHDPDRDLWFDTSVDEDGLVSYSPHRWNPDTQQWVSIADQRTAALKEALGDFEGTVEQRFDDADEALDGLRDSLIDLDETTLPSLRQNLDDAEVRIGAAEREIETVFGDVGEVRSATEIARQTAERALASASNLTPRGSAEVESMGQYVASNPSGDFQLVTDASSAYQGKTFLRYTHSGSAATLYLRDTPDVMEGRTYRVTIAARLVSGTSGGSNGGYAPLWYDSNGSSVNMSAHYPTELWRAGAMVGQVNAGWQVFSGYVTPPPGRNVVKLRPRLYFNAPALSVGAVLDLDAITVQDVTEAKAALDAAADADANAQAYADTARRAAIDAAALDATAKAEAAEAAAAATAATDAQTRADAAQAAAEEAARAYAEAIATGVEPADLDALRDHMNTKAAQAEQAAIDAAALDAEAKVEAAEARAALEAARVAQEKADQALADAKADASSKADAAQAAAEERAQDAQDAADAAMAEAESKATVEYILSRGTDLVTNGTGYLGDNTNFSGFVFDPADTPTGTRGAFDADGPVPSIQSDELMPVDSSRRYLMRMQVRQTNPNITESIFYAGVVPYDGDGLSIRPFHYRYNAASLTPLAQDLNRGDTVAVVEGGDWSDSYYVHFGAWNYKDAAGKTWGKGTYTRNTVSGRNPTKSGSQVTLPAPWPYDTVPAGTYVSAMGGGGDYMYVVGGGSNVAPLEWTTFSGSTEKGAHDGRTGPAVRRFPQGTAAIKLIFRMSYQYRGVPAGEVSRQSIAAVSFSDATLALEEAEKSQAQAQAAQDAAEAAHEAAGDASAAADAAMNRANAVKGEAEDYANGLPKVLHGTTTATGTAPDGSIWWQHQGSLGGPVIGQWNRVNGAWRPTPIDSEAIANLDLGKLTAGAAEIAELVSRKIAAATGRFLEIDVGQLTVTEQSRLADVVAEQIAAEVGRFLELEVGKLVASEGILDEAVIRQLFAEVVVAQMVSAEAFIGGNAILEGSITAESGIIGSLDLGVAIVGKLHGMYIEAGSIDTEQLAFGAATGDVLSVDALNFKRAVGLDLSAPSIRVGDAVEITEDFGIRQFGPDGALNVALPSDGSEATFRGDLSARTLTATGRMSIQGPGAVASGGVLELESGVVPPVAGPQITNTWDRTTFPPLSDQESPGGLVWADGHWWRAVQTSVPIAEDGQGRLEKITPTGELVSSFPVGFRSEIYGITYLDGVIYVLGWPLWFGRGDRYVIGYDFDGTETTRWVYPNYGTGTWKPGIGTHGTNLLIGQSWSNGDFNYGTYRPHDGYRLSLRDTGRKIYSDIVALNIGQFDHDSTRLIVACRRSGEAGRQFISYSNTNPHQYYPDEAWYAADMEPIGGAAWDGQQFYSLSSNGDLAAYNSAGEDRFVGDGDDDWWAAVTWQRRDPGTPTDDGWGNVILRQTTVGPATRFTYLHRANIRIQTGDAPVGAGGYTVYLAKGDQYPAREDLHWVYRIDDAQHWSFEIRDVVDFWETTATPPTTNTFPSSTPGEIRSAIGGFRVDGAGAGSWGSFDFHSDGTVTGKGTLITGYVEHPLIQADGASHQVTVTFPAGRFSTPPLVLATNTNGRLTPVVALGGTTATSTTIRAWNFTTGGASASRTLWAAIEED